MSAGSGAVTLDGNEAKRTGREAIDSTVVVHVPTRTCVGCRQRAAKSSLLRLVVADGAVVPDPNGRLPGRGAYLHVSRQCFDLAQRRRVLPRALRVPGPLGTTAVLGYLPDPTDADR